MSTFAFFGIGILAIPFLVAGTYLIMLPTSAFGIAAAILLRRQRMLSTSFCVITVLLHLTFVLDILSTLVVAAESDRVLVAAGRGRVASRPSARLITNGAPRP